MAGGWRGNWVDGAFWIVAGVEALCFVAWFVNFTVTPAGSQYDNLVALLLFGIACIHFAIMVTFLLVPNRVVHGIALVLVTAPPLLIGARIGGTFVTAPGAEALAAGHGYFKRPADRALADAVVTGDGAKVAELAPAADTNAVGLYSMSFMRLALDQGHADPAVIAALLKAGADPDQDNQVLFGSMTGSDAIYGMMMVEKNERLLRAVIEAGVDLNQHDREGRPRFFSGLKWPAGLALMLDHGANPEAEDKDGITAITWAVKLWYWPAIDVLLAHGARLDHVAHDGQGLRAAVQEKLEHFRGQRNEVPPQLAALAERLR